MCYWLKATLKQNKLCLCVQLENAISTKTALKQFLFRPWAFLYPVHCENYHFQRKTRKQKASAIIRFIRFSLYHIICYTLHTYSYIKHIFHRPPDFIMPSSFSLYLASAILFSILQPSIVIHPFNAPAIQAGGAPLPYPIRHSPHSTSSKQYNNEILSHPSIFHAYFGTP